MKGKWLAVAAVAAALALVAVAVSGTDLWRAAYPHLPRKVQAAPYVLRSRLASDATPVPLPTPAQPARLNTVPSPIAPGGLVNVPSPIAPGALVNVPSAIAPFGQSAVAIPSTPTSEIAVPVNPPPERVALEAPPHQYQTWNNCGPATVSMALGVLDTTVAQADAARRLKPDPDDKNVAPEELARYAGEMGLAARVRVGGTTDELMRLIALGLPVVVESWFIPKPGDEMGHYVLFHGYDRSAAQFTAADSYEGPGRAVPFDEFDRLWRVFNRTYVALYPPSRAAEVDAVWGPFASDEAMYRRAEATARSEIETGEDAFAWFNLGSSLAGLRDPAAATAFDRARALGLPWRMMWYQFGPFEAYAQAGRWDDVRALASASLVNAPNLEESHYWQGRAAQASGDLDAAEEEYMNALNLNPLFARAGEALVELQGSR